MHTVLALAAAALLSACASLAPSGTTLPETPLPASWSAPKDAITQGTSATVLAQWWQRFDDPALTALVTQALQANTSVRGAQAALLQARAQRDVQQA
ncbi:MAG: TolC family protein, partial [Hydrogenophaga sp.]|nr:TolC family protein [Hydrogenophaga sp.]